MLEAAVFCLSLNLYHESRGESDAGKRMVAMVTMNRAEWDERKVCPVVFASAQFSWTNGNFVKTPQGYALHVSVKPRDKKMWQRSERIARQVLRAGRLQPHLDFSKGATYYHATWLKQKPAWARKMVQVARVGQHVFYIDPNKLGQK